MRVHVRDGDDPIKIVMLVDIGVVWQAFLLAPALKEATPEKIADRDAIWLLMAQSFVHTL